MRYFLSFLSLVFLMCGCTDPSADPTATNGTNQSSNSTADYAKSWNVIANGNFHTVMTFNENGVMVQNSHPTWVSGSISNLGNGYNTINSVYTDNTATFNGLLYYPSKDSASGMFTTNRGQVGNWCMSVVGQPYITNSDIVGIWNISMGTSTNSTNFNFTVNANGTIETSTNPQFVSGQFVMLGGLKVSIKMVNGTVSSYLVGQYSPEYISIGGTVNNSDGTNGQFGCSKLPQGNG